MTDLNSSAATILEREALINRVFTDAEDGETFEVVRYLKGWYTLVNIMDERVTMKLRHDDLVDGLEDEDFEVEDEAEDEEAESKMAGQLRKYRELYVPTIAASGRKSLSNGDTIAMALEMHELDGLYQVVAALTDMDCTEKYAHLNVGSQRMNLGNRLRAAYMKEDHKHHTAVKEWADVRAEGMKAVD